MDILESFETAFGLSCQNMHKLEKINSCYSIFFDIIQLSDHHAAFYRVYSQRTLTYRVLDSERRDYNHT